MAGRLAQKLAVAEDRQSMLASIQDLIRELGTFSVPSIITQEPFDNDASHYRRLCRSGKNPDPIDLSSYAQDMMYQELQRDLFIFFLPICLSAWQDDLIESRESTYAGFFEQLSAALAKHAGFRDLLSPTHYVAVSNFMRNAILDKIDQEKKLAFSSMRDSPYSWIYTIGTFGTAFPSVSDLWEEWWSCLTVGRACGVLQYASVLMYPEDRNPIFSPWTPDAGGGAPVLWETNGHIFDQSWLPENLEFLRTTLTPGYVRESISAAALILRGETDSSVPEKMISNFDNAVTFVELRIEELIQYLSLPLGEVGEWQTT